MTLDEVLDGVMESQLVQPVHETIDHRLPADLSEERRRRILDAAFTELWNTIEDLHAQRAISGSDPATLAELIQVVRDATAFYRQGMGVLLAELILTRVGPELLRGELGLEPSDL
jgi:hypothetical protein